ncbi:response regulator [Paraferrimonas sedimenticola]|uniref:DNA-binding response regulator n=1 Tax=Paraferrimonas sedimenticola TaxID=375674 RepID=A0AA37RVI7_9GAMM|nr:response regulator [Paraferrimonas sedimenticola]GLP96126.1 DNA-binding response regulator [Paraferrimonas sedimenticola]
MINVYLVDDHDIVRTGVRRILEDDANISVIGEANTGECAVKWAEGNEADVVLMDLNMPGIGGIEATRRILELNPQQRILILTVAAGEAITDTMDQVGAFGFITKDSLPSDMITAVRKVASGQRLMRAACANSQLVPKEAPSAENFNSLSKRELQIAYYIANGKKAADIAEILELSRKTINSFRYRIFKKLHIESDQEMAKLAAEYGLVDLPFQPNDQ